MAKTLVTVVPPAGPDHAFRIDPAAAEWVDLADPPIGSEWDDVEPADEADDDGADLIEGQDWQERSVVRWAGGWTLLVGLSPERVEREEAAADADIFPKPSYETLLGVADGLFLPNEDAAELECWSGTLVRANGRGHLHCRAVPAADWLAPHGGPPLATPARAPRWRWLRTPEDRVVQEHRPLRFKEREVLEKWDETWKHWLLRMEVWRVWESCRCGIETPQFDPLTEAVIDPHDLTEAWLSRPRVERYGPPVEPVLTRVLTRAKREDLLHYFRGMTDVPPELAGEVRARAERRAEGAAAGPAGPTANPPALAVLPHVGPVGDKAPLVLAGPDGGSLRAGTDGGGGRWYSPRTAGEWRRIIGKFVSHSGGSGALATSTWSDWLKPGGRLHKYLHPDDRGQRGKGWTGRFSRDCPDVPADLAGSK